jgi:PAS domain S-box-containing protein
MDVLRSWQVGGLADMSMNPLTWIGRALGALVPGVRDLRGHVAAIGRTTPIIHFGMDGLVQYANEQFLKASGYKSAEIRGQHHRMFVDADQRDTPAYRQFWSKLRAGETQSAQYMRLGKDGKPIWVQATYYPILDAFGTAFQSDQAHRRCHAPDAGACEWRRAARGHQQGAGRAGARARWLGVDGECQFSEHVRLFAGRSARAASRHVCGCGRA